MLFVEVINKHIMQQIMIAIHTCRLNELLIYANKSMLPDNRSEGITTNLEALAGKASFLLVRRVRRLYYLEES